MTDNAGYTPCPECGKPTAIRTGKWAMRDFEGGSKPVAWCLDCSCVWVVR